MEAKYHRKKCHTDKMSQDMIKTHLDKTLFQKNVTGQNEILKDPFDKSSKDKMPEKTLRGLALRVNSQF